MLLHAHSQSQQAFQNQNSLLSNNASEYGLHNNQERRFKKRQGSKKGQKHSNEYQDEIGIKNKRLKPKIQNLQHQIVGKHSLPVQLSVNEEKERIQMIRKDGKVSNQNLSVQSCQNYFDQKKDSCRKRTFNILKQFDPALASEVIYKEGLLQHKLSRYDLQERRKIESSTIIQKLFRGYQARKLYREMLYKKLIEEEERQRIQDEEMIEQWLLEQRTHRNQKKIEDNG